MPTFLSRLRHRRPTPNAIQTHSEAPEQRTHACDVDSSDRIETKERFVKGATCLKEAVQWWQRDGDSSLDFPELAGEPETFDKQFREKLDKALDSRKDAKGGETITGIFTALSPFAKNFLTIAKEAQSVFSIKMVLITLDIRT